MQAQVNHWDTVLAVSQQARQDSFRRLSEQKEALQNRQQQLNQYQSRLQDIITSENLIEKTRSDLKHQANDVTSKIETLVTGIAPVEKELAEQEEALNKTLETQNAAASALTGAERNNAQAQLEFSRQREALDSIRRRMEEDLGFVTLPDESSEGGQAPLPFEGLVEALPIVTSLSQGIDDQISRLRAQLRRLGAVNVEAREEYESVKERHEFLTSQMADLHKADADLRSVIQELDGLMRRDFLKVFSSVAVEFRQMFTRLFQGGHARLVLADEENPIETGIDIEARLPGRREQGLSLLSGGERSLTAVALIFALLKVSPTPFCVMDEVDAMLDEANVNRFCELLAELAKTTQFVLITHNRNTVQTADVIYGVTMGRDSSSQLISLKLDQVSDELVG
jgi:chromosome segregation protein